MISINDYIDCLSRCEYAGIFSRSRKQNNEAVLRLEGADEADKAKFDILCKGRLKVLDIAATIELVSFVAEVVFMYFTISYIAQGKTVLALGGSIVTLLSHNVFIHSNHIKNQAYCCRVKINPLSNILLIAY